MTDLEKLKAETAAVNRLQAWLDAEDGSHFGQHETDIETLIDLARERHTDAALAAQDKEPTDENA